MSKDHFRQTDQDNASKNCYIAANKPANVQATAATSAALDTDSALESYSAEFEDTAPRLSK
jgi:hypothetical protein